MIDYIRLRINEGNERAASYAILPVVFSSSSKSCSFALVQKRECLKAVMKTRRLCSEIEVFKLRLTRQNSFHDTETEFPIHYSSPHTGW